MVAVLSLELDSSAEYLGDSVFGVLLERGGLSGHELFVEGFLDGRPRLQEVQLVHLLEAVALPLQDHVAGHVRPRVDQALHLLLELFVHPALLPRHLEEICADLVQQQYFHRKPELNLVEVGHEAEEPESGGLEPGADAI